MACLGNQQLRWRVKQRLHALVAEAGILSRMLDNNVALQCATFLHRIPVSANAKSVWKVDKVSILDSSVYVNADLSPD